MKAFRQFKKRIAKQGEGLINWWRNYDIKEKTQILLVLFSCLSFISIVVFGCIQGCQTRKALVMSKNSNDTDNIMRIKDTLARDRITKMELRAYFSIDSFKCYSFKSKIIFGKIGIKMINTGKTPVYSISYKNDYRIGREVIQEDFDSLATTEFNRGSACIGSNQTLTIDVNIFDYSFTQGKYDSIYKGIINTNFFGKIIYYDIFGSSHYTRYNVRLIPSEKRFYINKNFNDGN